MRLNESQLRNLIKQTIKEASYPRYIHDGINQWATKVAQELVALKRDIKQEPTLEAPEKDRLLLVLRNLEQALDELLTV